MWKIWGVISATIAMGFVAGCGQDQADDTTPESLNEESGIALSVDFQGDTDVTGFEYTIRECGEETTLMEEVKELEDVVIPGMIPNFERGPFDPSSRHTFADYFTTIDAGCYDITAQPVTENSQNSQDCSLASASEVFVVDKMTTEVLLVSQCEGPEKGATDVVGTLNHPPVIESVEYSPSKFLQECENGYVCVTAYDPDGDPLEFDVEKTKGAELRFGTEIVSVETDGDYTTGCFRAVPVWKDDYEFQVNFYDQMWDDDEQVRIEDHIDEQSRAQLEVPLYSVWGIELECYDQENDEFHRFEGVREIDHAEGCQPIWPEQYYCSDMHWDETDRTCPGGDYRPEEVYPLCEDHEGQYVVE